MRKNNIFEKVNRFFASLYQGAASSKSFTRFWFSWGASAKQETLGIAKLRERSRDLYRNDSIARAVVETLVEHVIGAGLKLQVSLEAEKLGISSVATQSLENALESEFAAFARSIDVMQNEPFDALQRTAYRSYLLGGDLFFRLPLSGSARTRYETRLELLEADEIASGLQSSDGFIDGIRFGKKGFPKSYRVEQIDAMGRSSEKFFSAYSRIDGRRLFFHVISKFRPGQARGVPLLAPVLTVLKQLYDYSEAELSSAKVAARMSTVLTSPTELTGASVASYEEDPEPEKMQIKEGEVAELLPGQKIEVVESKRPGKSLLDFMTTHLKQVGAALRLPYEVFLGSFHASYSASRAALLQAWTKFQSERHFFAKSFCDPVFDAFLEEVFLKGVVDLPVELRDRDRRSLLVKTTWLGAPMPQVDPLKEAKAQQLLLSNFMKTYKTYFAEKGKDFDEVLRTLQAESEALAKLRAKKQSS